MAVIKYTAVHTTPKAHLKYILNPKKNEEQKYVSSICCNSEFELVYEDFKELFEMYDSEKFDLREKNKNGKTHIRIHSYIQSFDAGVTAEQAHKIGVQWAKEMFGENRPVIISTHINTHHAHNHIAVCPCDIYGHRFLANKATLKLARSISDTICIEHGLPIIENPKQKGGISYAEWLARNNGTSWKMKMADDIDRVILDENVTDIESLVSKMKENGYIFTNEEKLIAKPEKVRYGCSICRLGHGYTKEYLQCRISSKRFEVLGRDLANYDGEQLHIILCLRDIQRTLYRDDKNWFRTETELKYNVELLNFISKNDISSKPEFEKYVNEVSLKAHRAENTYLQRYILYPGDYEKQRQLKEEMEKAQAVMNTASKQYRHFLVLEEELNRFVPSPAGKAEYDIYEKRIKMQRNYIKKLDDISQWCKKVHQRAEQLRLLEKQREETQRSSRSDYSR